MTYKICIEGIDGSGKKTQIGLLKSFLESEGFSVGLADFPCYDSFVGSEIGQFLNPQSPHNAATMDVKSLCLWYAVDRLMHYRNHTELYSLNDFLLINRYTLTNMAFQSARISDPVKREEIVQWIYNLEHKVFQLPEPDIYIILDIDPKISMAWKSRQLHNEVRNYSNEMDVNEIDVRLQVNTAMRYRAFAQSMPNVSLVCCYDDEGKPYSKEEIFESIVNLIQSKRAI